MVLNWNLIAFHSKFSLGVAAEMMSIFFRHLTAPIPGLLINPGDYLYQNAEEISRNYLDN